MNWEFHAVHTTDSKELIKQFSQLAVEGLEQWLAGDEWSDFLKASDKQPEAGFSEFPPGYFHEGASYKFRFRAYGPGGCLDKAEYFVKVEQTFRPDFDQDVWDKHMSSNRIRFIHNREGIA